MKIEILVDVKTTLGEGPLWDVQQQRLYWVDSLDGRVFRCTADGGELRAWELGQRIGSMTLRREGTHAVVALKGGLYDLDLGDGKLDFIVDPEPNLPLNRLNDGKVDAAGRFLFGSMDTLGESTSAKLYRLDPDMSLHTLEDKIVVSNGPCLEPRPVHFLLRGHMGWEIWSYDYDLATGTPSRRRCFAPVDRTGGGAADGATVDSEGFLWQALVYAGQLVRYSPDGNVDRVIEMPVKKVTSLVFGGPDLDVLYVTSMARPPLPRFPEDGQHRGALFAITGLGVRGLPATRFGS